MSEFAAFRVQTFSLTAHTGRAFTYDSSGMAEVTSSNFGLYVVAIDNVTVDGAVLSPAAETVSQMDALLDTGKARIDATAFGDATPG